MLDAAVIALENLFVPTRMMFLFLGVLMGLALGAIPGLGGLVGLAILLPFTFDMDPYVAFRRRGNQNSTSRAPAAPAVRTR